MVPGAFAFLCGVLAVLWLPTAPHPGWLALAPVALGCAVRPRLRLLAWVLGGALWALLGVHLNLSARLPAGLEGMDVPVRATVLDAPRVDARRIRFPARVRTLDPARPWAGRVRLSWYGDAPALAPGDVWYLTVRLKRPRGMLNPGGRDYEARMFRLRFAATGYVRPGEAPARRVGRDGDALADLRAALDRRVAGALGEHAMAGAVRALTVGRRDGLQPRHWEVLRATGTTHLMAISGLHVGMLSALAFALARRFWPAPERLAAPRGAALVALAVAAGYAALSGFALPAQRALAMTAGFLLAVLMGRPVVSGHNLALALLVVLTVDPLAPLSPGFWLSFTAVAVILLAVSGRVSARRGAWARWGQVHLVVAVGLAPVLLWSFGENPLVSPLANAVAVPWVAGVVVPAALGGMVLSVVLPEAGGWVLAVAAESLDLLWWLLGWFAEWGWVHRAAPAWTAAAAAMAGVALLLGPRGLGVAGAGLLWLVPALAPAPDRLAPGSVRATVLDVGQGLAVVVETRRRVLVYDTGPPLGPGFDAGRAAVIPFLERLGRRRVDTLVVSHGDSDHSGGAASLLERLPVGRVFGPDSVPGARPCARGAGWAWEGVRFRFLHPGPGERWSDNSGSCVLHVAAPGGALLLPGDLEAVAERWVAARQGEHLAAEVLVAGHHGSRTSTTEFFLDRVEPEVAVFSAGYRNRWGFPHPEVVSRLGERGVQMVNTAHCGAASFILGPDGLQGPECHRKQARRLWHAPRPVQAINSCGETADTR